MSKRTTTGVTECSTRREHTGWWDPGSGGTLGGPDMHSLVELYILDLFGVWSKFKIKEYLICNHYPFAIWNQVHVNLNI